MSELIDAPEIAEIEDGDLLPMRKAGAAGLVKATFEAFKAAILAGGSFLPTGGTLGQVLGKASSDDGDVEWIDQTGGGGGGTDLPTLTGNAGKVLTVNEAEDAVEWIAGGSGGGGGNMHDGWQYAPPAEALFPIAAGGLTVTETDGAGLLLSAAPAGDSKLYKVKTFTGDMDVKARVRTDSIENYNGLGLCLLNSPGINTAYIYLFWNDAFRVEMNNSTGGNESVVVNVSEIWLRIKYNATTGDMIFYISKTGIFWRQLWTFNQMGLNKVGLMLLCRNSTYSSTGQVLYYSDTNNPAPTPSLGSGGGSGGGVEEAPNDGNIYARQNEAWVEVDVDPITPFHRYWRYLQTGAGTMNCVELQFRSERGGADITPSTGGQAIARDWYNSSYVPANAFDNNTATGYGPGTGGAGSYLGYDFGVGNAVEVVEFTYDARFSGGQPAAGELQYSDDGAGWLTAFAVPAIPGTATYTINSDGLT